MKKLVLFGAGKIGRSFIAQLFSRSGYEVVFIDIDKKVINALNEKGEYKVVVKSEKGDNVIVVKNVRGILSTDTDTVTEELSNADLVATSVGPNVIPRIIPILTEGLRLRFKVSPKEPLDIILAENLRDAAQIVKKEMRKYLPDSYDIDNLVGLVETSIGKMVPIIPDEVIARDPLIVYAEPYNTLIIDKKGFKNSLPDVEGLAFKENMTAWVDRKSFIHNLGHAAAAYYSYSHYPDLIYLYEAVNKKDVKIFARKTMLQSASVLMRHYPGEFTEKALIEHIDDLLYRFSNKALGDTIFRVGQDLFRKLGPEDRITGVLKLAVKYKLPYDKILQTLKYAMKFKASDPSGNRSENDIKFTTLFEKEGTDYILENICMLDRMKYSEIYKEIASES